MILRREVAVDDRFDVVDDPAFAGMCGALDPDIAGKHVVSLAGGDVELQSIRVVRYKPGKRFLVEYRLSSSAGPVVVLGKVRAKGLDTRAYEIQSACWASGLPVPEPLGVVPECGMWLQRRIPGRDLMAALLADDRVDPEVMRDTADLIYTLHRSGVPAKRTHRMSDELAILHERLRGLACERPALSGRIAGLLLAAERTASQVQPGRETGIHRDFYPEQVVSGPDGLWLVDFDLYAQGDPALDVGNFSGHLIELGVRLAGDPARYAREQEAFERRYLERYGDGKRPAIDLYTSLTLARHIQLSTRFPERRHTTMPLLDLCEERLRRACA